MDKIYRQGAVGALMDEYEKAISELKVCIKNIADKDLITLIDTKTTNDECKSIQTILTHVVSSAYSYAVYIQNLKGINAIRPVKTFHTTVAAYLKDLNEVMIYTATFFKEIKDEEIEQFDNSKKIATAWGQQYDIEQLIEHAIVHVLRHRRQIEKFKIALGKI